MTAGAEFEHALFWEEHRLLLQDPWDEWEVAGQIDEEEKAGVILPGSVNNNFLDPDLSRALKEAFGNPSEEAAAALYWTTGGGWRRLAAPLPGCVHSARLLVEARIRRFHRLPPSQRDEPRGGLSWAPPWMAPSLRHIRAVEDDLVRRVARPIGQALFPDRFGCGNNVEYFAFTIRYNGSEGGGASPPPWRDVEVNEHRDALVVTLTLT